jgi:hypothetical protein
MERQRGARTAPTQPLPAERLSRPKASAPTPSLEKMSPEVVREACEAVNALGSARSAIIGGCAVDLLGARRGTKDVDILVPDRTKRSVRAAMEQSDQFWVGKAPDRRQMFKASNHRSYNVDIIQPADLGLDSRYAESGAFSIGGARILKPALLLNLKVYSWNNPDRNEDSKLRDLRDIGFLLDYMYRNEIQTSPDEVDLISPDLLSELIGNNPPDASKWRDIGLPNSRASSQQKGRSSQANSSQSTSSSKSQRSGQAGPSARPKQAAESTRRSKGKASHVSHRRAG